VPYTAGVGPEIGVQLTVDFFRKRIWMKMKTVLREFIKLEEELTLNAAQ